MCTCIIISHALYMEITVQEGVWLKQVSAVPCCLILVLIPGQERPIKFTWYSNLIGRLLIIIIYCNFIGVLFEKTWRRLYNYKLMIRRVSNSARSPFRREDIQGQTNSKTLANHCGRAWEGVISDDTVCGSPPQGGRGYYNSKHSRKHLKQMRL